jgi:hypothetical protein
MLSAKLVLLILALLCFILHAAEIRPPRADMQSLGLAFWVLAVLVG